MQQRVVSARHSPSIFFKDFKLGGNILRLLCLLLLSFTCSAESEPLTALVIGNAAYRSASLKNPANDAADIAAQLRELGFRVNLLTDINQQAMDEAVRNFGAQLRRGGVGLFYYAGHAIQLGGDNWLLPIGHRISRSRDLKYRAVNLNSVLEEMGLGRARLNMVILDACRDNPLPAEMRSGLSRGLSPIKNLPSGTFLGFATAPGETAADGDENNSPYTQELLAHLQTPDIVIEELFKRVARGVQSNTHGEQTPWYSSSFTGEFSFKKSDIEADLFPSIMELTYWQSIIDSKDTALYQSYLNQYPEGKFAPIAQRLIEKQTNTVTPQAPKHQKNEPLPTPSKRPLNLAEDLARQMVYLPGDCFQMGSPIEEAGRSINEKTHPICVNPFAMSKYEITRGQFRQFIKSSGYRTDAETERNNKPGCYSYINAEWRYARGRYWDNNGSPQTDHHPVSCVSWSDVQQFLIWLNQQEGNHRFRLPTEAEWEFAARAGTSTSRFWGESPDRACDFGNIADSNRSDSIDWNPSHRCDDGYNQNTAPVGSYRSNLFGLYDMLGNVWEWTCSRYHPDYLGYEEECEKDTLANHLIVNRGGSTGSMPRRTRSAYRARTHPFNRNDRLGFRLVKE